jgi:outer membrane protein TolC
MNARYAAAIEAHNEAIRIYDAVRAAYRAGKIDDAEYIAARSAYQAATAIYDAEYEIACNIPEDAQTATDDNAQHSLFA